jgi:hypothetical protein
MREMEERRGIDLRYNLATDKKSGKEEIEELLKGGKAEDGVKMLLDEMLRFLAEMPVDKYHDYKTFRHGGLRGYLINRFLREKWNEDVYRPRMRTVIGLKKDEIQ